MHRCVLVPTPGRRLPPHIREMANEQLIRLAEMQGKPPARVALDERWSLAVHVVSPALMLVHVHPVEDAVEGWIPWALRNHAPTLSNSARRFE
jgi:hypothetical protein